MTIDKNGRIESRKALVTGGSFGIGSSLVKKFSEARIQTAFADIKAPETEVPGAQFFNIDITKRNQIDSLYQTIIETLGAPDILISNAGQGIHEKLSEGDPELWAKIIDLNVCGALRVIRSFLPDMLKKGFGDIVFVSSVSSKQAYEGGAVYSASKAALDMIAETLRLEVQPHIRVTTISPGVVDTGFFKNIIHGSQTPESIGWGSISPDDVADAIFYAVTRPAGIVLNNLTIRPVAQP